MGAWPEKLSCAVECQRCNRDMTPDEPRILSVYDHEAICMNCKKTEEQRPDYETISKQTIGQCLDASELRMNDPQGYCYHHFYSFYCR